MNQINKPFFILIALSGFLFVGVSTALEKLFSFILSENINRCQTFFHSLAVEIFPYHLRTILWIVIVFLFLFILIRIFFLGYRLLLLKKYITNHLVASGVFMTVFKKYQLEHKVFLLRSHDSFAFCFGILSPKIYISLKTAQMVTERELAAILLHEKYHLEHRDSLFSFISFFVQILFPFFPLLADILHHYFVDREIKADQAAIAGLGDVSPLKLALKKMLLFPSPSFVASAAVADDTLELRIRMLVTGQRSIKRFPWLHLIISVFFLLLLTFVIVIPVKAIELPRYEQKAIVVCLNGTSCQTVCSTGNYSAVSLLKKSSAINASFSSKN